MPNLTTSYSFNKPVVGGDDNAWGGYLNTNWDSVDDLLDGTSTVTGMAITNGAFTTPSLTGTPTEEVYTISGTSYNVEPDNGSIQTWALTANSSASVTNMANGQAITMMISDGSSRTLSWSGVSWVGGSAPTLATSGYTVVALWKVASTVYGSHIGDTA
jgi:hypothetical protein